MAELLDTLRDAAGSARCRAVGPAQLLMLLRELEDIKSMASALQADVAVAFEQAVLADRAAHDVPARHRARGVAAEVAIARRESPHRGSQLLGLARALVREMPRTLEALRVGQLTEFRAMVLVRETACLSRFDRATVDAELCSDPSTIETWGTGRIGAEARRWAYRLDPVAFVSRAAHARTERHVSLRPTPDTMTWFGALLPVEHGVAVRGALGRAADAASARDSTRSRTQLMADALVERVTGLDLGVDRPGSKTNGVPVRVHLTVSDQTLLAGGAEPAWVSGYGPVPAQVARDLVRRAEADSLASLRRLYVVPETGALVAADSRARIFPRALAELIALRDRTCRTPWCDAPVRHSDHIAAWIADGGTSVHNGQGLCERCNHEKQAAGWASRPVASPPGDPPGRHRIEVTTPYAQTLVSRAPDLPRPCLAPSRDAERAGVGLGA